MSAALPSGGDDGRFIRDLERSHPALHRTEAEGGLVLFTRSPRIRNEKYYVIVNNNTTVEHPEEVERTEEVESGGASREGGIERVCGAKADGKRGRTGTGARRGKGKKVTREARGRRKVKRRRGARAGKGSAGRERERGEGKGGVKHVEVAVRNRENGESERRLGLVQVMTGKGSAGKTQRDAKENNVGAGGWEAMGLETGREEGGRGRRDGTGKEDEEHASDAGVM
ncbi:hypothetical protein DFH09DRAFT_1472804 [Mycena vulgaris]|nr:hypothetical protein DFH09DRAFT_1472804 [Mycena vulgaris]